SRPCARLFGAIEELKVAYPHLRIAFFHAYDGADENQPGARILHLGAVCAAEQGDLWSYLRNVYARNPRGEIGVELVEDVAVRSSRAPERLRDCLTSERAARDLDARRAAGAGVTRTPTVVVGGLAYLGERDFYQLSLMLDTQLRPGLLGRYLWPLAGP